jgi:hypothetical protein
MRGQQEALPPVTPKAAAETATFTPSVLLTTTPIVVYMPSSLSDAAAKNDYVGFAALYNDMKQRGESVDAYKPLYDLWTWSLATPTGAFYGEEMYVKLADAYPTFADSIAPYAIVDDAGNTFWPTSETRDFLLARASSGRTRHIRVAPAQRVKTAAVITPKETPKRERVAKDNVRAETPKASGAAAASAAGLSRETAGRERPPLHKTAPQPAPAPKPVETALPQVQVAPKPAPQPVAQTAPKPVEQPKPAPIEVVQPQPASAPAPAPVAEAPVEQPRTGGMLILIALAILGVGLFVMLMRSPAEEQTTSLNLNEKPPAPVESINSRRTGTGEQQAPPKAQAPPDGNVRGMRR